MELKQFVENFVTFTQGKIRNLALAELNNEFKKKKLDEAVVTVTKEYINKLQVNFIIKLVIKQAFIPLIPTITQAIYDLFKAKF